VSALLDTDPVLPRSSIVGGHFRLGASTGAYADIRGDWEALIRRAWRLSDAAVELAALSEPELPDLVAFLDSSPTLPFRFVSTHAPTKARVSGDAELASALGKLPSTVDAVVLHPDTLTDLSPFGVLGARAVVENMDARKPRGRTVAELEEVFDVLPEARFCLDVGHAWSVDPSMELAHDLLDAFRLRLSHLHISSLTDACKHAPLTPEVERRFAPVLARCYDMPWILEAV
jgi:hypothetical protein